MVTVAEKKNLGEISNLEKNEETESVIRWVLKKSSSRSRGEKRGPNRKVGWKKKVEGGRVPKGVQKILRTFFEQRGESTANVETEESAEWERGRP